MSDDARRYPEELTHTVTTSDGVPVLIRAIRPGDDRQLIALYDRLSLHSAYHRFFTVMRRLPPDWARMLADVDYRTRLALVAEAETAQGRQVVGVARWEPTEDAGTVEVAFVVEDGWQNKRLGTVLLHDLLRAAEARGIRRFRAYVLADNRRMLDLLARFTTIAERTLEHGVVELTFTRAAPQAPAGPGAISPP